jgi:hypothetical protein
MEGYVQAAHWHDPQAASYLALSLAAMASDGIQAELRHRDGVDVREGRGAQLHRDDVSQRVDPHVGTSEEA